MIKTKCHLYSNYLKFKTFVFLEKAFVEDSLFPFKAGENLTIRIDKDRLIISKFKG
jgi:hypothetical protein